MLRASSILARYGVRVLHSPVPVIGLPRNRLGLPSQIDRRKRAIQNRLADQFHIFRWKPITQVSTKAWYAALERVGISEFRWHDLRLTWASCHVQQGTSLFALQELGGWESREMVRRYAHLNADHLAHQNQQHVQGALAKLDGRIVVGSSTPSAGAQDQRDLHRTTQRKRTCARKGSQVLDKNGRPCRDRTYDQRIKSPLLYQLS
jgi:Phage integrase family